MNSVLTAVAGVFKKRREEAQCGQKRTREMVDFCQFYAYILRGRSLYNYLV